MPVSDTLKGKFKQWATIKVVFEFRWLKVELRWYVVAEVPFNDGENGMGYS